MIGMQHDHLRSGQILNLTLRGQLVHVAIRLDETRWCPFAHIIVEPTVRN